MMKEFWQFVIHNIYKTVLTIFLPILSRLIVVNSNLEKKNASIDDIQVLHYSANFIVVNKRHDVLINSNNPNNEVTVQTQLKKIAPELVNQQLVHEFNFVHRLDFATSGILCLPTNKPACRLASEAFEQRRVEKYYLAIVRGYVSQEIIDVELGIGIDSRREFRGIRMALEGQPYVTKMRSASTRVLILERGISHGYPATKVLLKPWTGRRHQLRLHLNALGHTIVGDYTYSNRRDVEPYRMFLHAFRYIMPTQLEDLDVRTVDPFGGDEPLNRWRRVELVNALDDSAMMRIKEEKGKILVTAKLNMT